jgi:hypothetical protein
MTMPQNMQALALANAVRYARSADKKRIKLGELDPLDVLEDPPNHWRNARVLELLLAMPYVGKRRATSWLMMANVSATRPLGAMPAVQRHRLRGFVEYGKRPPLT